MKEEKDTNLFDLLILFFRWIGRGFRNMFRGIGWCLQLNFQYIILTPKLSTTSVRIMY